MKNLIHLLFCFATAGMFAQPPVDTSYTVWGTYHKERKTFPLIKIAQRPSASFIRRLDDLVYASRQGRALHLDAFFNTTDAPQPAVILIHGGGWKSGNKSQTRLLAQQIAAAGYACFCVEYRLSGEAIYPAAVNDVKTAIRYVKANATQFNADASRVAVLGCSSGGQLAALVGTTGHRSLDALQPHDGPDASVQGIVDMDGILAFHHPESEEGKAASLWLGGPYEARPEVWRQASALTHTDKDTPPILFINSGKKRFHAGRDDMIALLDQHHIYHEVKTLDPAPHSFWFFDPWFDQIVIYTTEFLDIILKQQIIKK